MRSPAVSRQGRPRHHTTGTARERRPVAPADARARAGERVQQGAGARIEGVRGPLVPQRLVLLPDRPRTLRVGSGADCELRAQAPHIEALQFELVWDGQALWARDPLCLGRTFVGSDPLAGWRLLSGKTLLRFGSCALWVRAPERAQRRSGPAPATVRDSQSPNLRKRSTGRMTVLPSEATRPRQRVLRAETDSESPAEVPSQASASVLSPASSAAPRAPAWWWAWAGGALLSMASAAAVHWL